MQEQKESYSSNIIFRIRQISGLETLTDLEEFYIADNGLTHLQVRFSDNELTDLQVRFAGYGLTHLQVRFAGNGLTHLQVYLLIMDSSSPCWTEILDNDAYIY